MQTAKICNIIRAGPRVSPTRHWAGATLSIGQPQGKKIIRI